MNRRRMMQEAGEKVPYIYMDGTNYFVIHLSDIFGFECIIKSDDGNGAMGSYAEALGYGTNFQLRHGTNNYISFSESLSLAQFTGVDTAAKLRLWLNKTGSKDIGYENLDTGANSSGAITKPLSTHANFRWFGIGALMFSADQTRVTSHFTGKCYEMIIYINGEEVYHFIPYKDADGVGCFYDTINDTYNYAAYGSPFVYGEE